MTRSPRAAPYGNEPPGVAFFSSATLGDCIRARRLELKLTVKKCAQNLKVEAKTVHGWEKHRHQPSAGVEKRIIVFLGYNPLPVPTTLAGKLLTYRKCLGLSQSAMAKKLGIDPTTLARMERGKSRNPSAKTLCKVEPLIQN